MIFRLTDNAIKGKHGPQLKLEFIDQNKIDLMFENYFKQRELIRSKEKVN